MSSTEGGELSEGELEDGEVLSSEDEACVDTTGEAEGGEGEKSVEESHGENGQTEKSVEDPPTIAGTKRPSLETDSPNPKASKTDPSVVSAAGNSDAEEGEIFSDDEEAAYFPQRIKSRSTTGTSRTQERESEASGSDAAEEKKNLSRSRGFSNSPDRDSYRSRQRRSREEERDSEPKSLATLFFEDRDGTQSELSDDGKEGRGRKKGDHIRHSSSPGSRSNRDRDRDRTPRDRNKRDRSYYRSKDSHTSRERDWDRDQDSNVDSSEEESSWSQRGSRSSGTKGYQSYQRGGRRGGSSYHSKYGQRHDRFGSATGNDSRGRQGWNPSSGRINTGMTAQECNALAEKVRKRREKGLSLLPTPKLKPTDNLDQFNYPAPPSWYLDAVEKWEKQQSESEKQGEEGGIQQAQSTAPPTVNIPTDQNKPPPLFPPSTQFTQPIETTNTLILGASLQSQVQPLMPGQPLTVSQPQLIAPLVQVPSLFPPTSAPCKPLVLPANNQTAVLGMVPPPPPLSGTSGTNGSGQSSLAVIGIGSEEGRTVVSTVRVSSLALTVTEGDGERDDMDEEEEEGRMKIALETPTPQSVTAEGKTFALFQAASTTEPEEKEDAVKEDVSKDEHKNAVNDFASPEVTSTEKKVAGEQEMEVDIPTQESTKEGISSGPESQPDSSTTAAIPPSLTSNGTQPLDSTSTSHPTASVAAVSNDSVYVQTYSPPVQAVTPPSPPLGPRVTKDTENKFGEEDTKNRVDSDPEMEDSDYDKYLDQLDEEEDEEDISGPSLVGAISASLLQNNPLDEDFPAINPVNKSQSKDVTLKSLLGENMVVDGGDRTGPKARGGSKTIRRRMKEAEWWSRQSNSSNKTSSVTNSTTTKPPCKYYLNGFCKLGAGCQFSHEGPRPKKKERCKFYLQDNCTKGDDCLYYHGDFPCKFFHTNTGCKNGENCKFSHVALTEETSQLLTQVLEPSRNPTKKAELAVLGISTPSIHATIPVLPLYEALKCHGVDSQVRGQMFSPGNPLDRFSDAVSEEHPLISPLLISIPKQVLDKSLIVSIPRQRLGPPFGTIPISTASSAPPNQASMPPPTLPPPSKPPQPTGLSPFAPQSSQMSTFLPSVQPSNSSLPTPPSQSVPPANFIVPPINFPMPPLPNQPPANFPPYPGGWQTASNQPIPLFPPGSQCQLPVPPNPNPSQLPPGPTSIPPQQNLPPSERKGLLPTPPSHLRLDPTTIQWPEEDKTEYWEAPELMRQSGRFPEPVSHPPASVPGVPPPVVPPPSGFFGAQPPPPHVPTQPVGSQQPPPSLSNNLRQQQGRMDPRQNRMESRPGGNMDPRRGGSGPANLHHALGATGTTDPRHHVSAPGNATLPPLPYQPPQGGTIPGQPPPMPSQGFQVQRQWPSHPPNIQQQSLPQSLPPLSSLHVPNHMSSGSGTSSGIPPGINVQGLQTQPGTGHFGTGINPPPFQQPPIPLSRPDGVPQPAMWGSSHPESSVGLSGMVHGAGNIMKGQRDGVSASSDVRSLRIDPRTKYSHFKIKPKGSPSSSSSPPVSSGAQSILKGKESDGAEQEASVGGGERTRMPKLLQEPPPLQRPFDPRELFDSASKEETADYQVSGHFGSKFGIGSFFMRSSAEAGGQEATDSLPYGEIRMTEADSASSKEQETATGASVERQDQESNKDGNVDTSTKKAAVPSYLAELGVGLGDSGLTIDSAFSSLDKNQDTSGQADGEKTQTTAKKLPSIFGFGSGTL